MVPGGTAYIGDEGPLAYPQDGESPVRHVSVAPFGLDAHAVNNARFATFVEATGHVTTAERFGWSFVFAGLLPDEFPETRGVVGAPWWRQVEGATWTRPEGPGSTVRDRADHPVVHVSAIDASAFARWAGKRLPTEVEWEHAARGGTTSTFPWGEELEPGGKHQANVWQGTFPNHNTAADGWYGTCPVDAFAANGYGLHNLIGNVWEWTAEPFAPGTDTALLKGGSYLCHASYCSRYRPAARSAAAPDSSMGNAGFRCATDAKSVA
ncbi:MAG: SUMF1/EgtB/PvdO family nonheme iron enzyme [Mycobacteriales bacterium]